MAPSKTTTLSPIDQLMPKTYTRIFLVLKTLDHLKAVDSLSAGLAALATRLPYLRGRISSTPAVDGSRLVITWSEADDAPLRLSEIPPAADTPSLDEIERTDAALHHFTDGLAPVRVLPAETAAPVFAASYTPIAGGLILCYCVHHAAMDGAGVADLAGLWAACTRGEVDSVVADADEPLRRLERLQEGVAATAERGESGPPLSFSDLMARHPQYRLLSTSAAPNPPAPPPPASTSHIFRFSAAKLSHLRAALAGASGSSRDGLTLNNLLGALLWSCVTRVRLARRGAAVRPSSSRLGFAVDGRRHLGSGFAPCRFLGNVNMYAVADAAVPVLETASTLASDQWVPEAASALAEVAGRIAAAAARVTAASVGEVLALVGRAPDVADLAPGWRSFHGTDLTMTSWANQGLYGVDFGGAAGGRPQFVRVPLAQFDGLCIVLPRRRDGEGEKIEVVCFLARDDLAALKGDEVWMTWF